MMTWFWVGYSLVVTLTYLCYRTSRRRLDSRHRLQTSALRKEILQLRAELAMTGAVLEEVRLEREGEDG